MNNRVISASAGSGKTHRLSIEYIVIILQNYLNPDFHFEKILVITFTRKAAAEIRNKIFSMLNDILSNKDKALIRQIEEKTGFEITDKILADLEKIAIKIRTQKDKVRISTIDSLINQVFKSMIAPVMKLTHYTIDESANYNVWESIFDDLTHDRNIEYLKSLVDKNPEKNVESLGKVFEKLIENRWVLHLILQHNKLVKSPYSGKYLKDTETLFQEIKQSEREFIDLFKKHCLELERIILEKTAKKKDSFSDYINKDIKEMLLHSLSVCNENQSSGIKTFSIDENNFQYLIDSFLDKGIYKLTKSMISSLIKNDAIKLYNGTKIRNSPLGNISELKTAFLRFVYYEYNLQENNKIIELWTTVLNKYDKIKQQSAVLSYSDITWFTYKYLYMPEYSMIDTERFIVENQFYEFLAVRNQFLLIDEFQDTSLMQFMILAPMINELSSGYSIHENTGVIIVGDEKQSIYGWRGGEKGLLDYMNTFLRTNIESLNTCYRSVPVIVDFVNELFRDTNFNDFTHSDKENWRYSGEITSAKPDKQGAVCNVFCEKENSTSNEPYFEFINNLVLPALQSGFQENGEFISPLGETAIIGRTNDELDMIAKLLAENNIPFVKESSKSIFDHIIPKSIMYLLKYIQYKDYNSLLRFLRSDIILIDSDKLKEIAMNINKLHNEDAENHLLTDIPSLKIIQKIYQKYHSTEKIDILYKNPLSLCHEIISLFNYTSVFPNETDIKNLHTFISIICDFLNDPKEFTSDLDGFIRYADILHEKKNKKQLSTQEENAISLITIHKSKGLGYDTVFLFFDTHTKKSFPTALDIDFIVCNQSYDKLSDVFISLNNKQVLKELFSADYELIEHKKNIEEMNNLYVALTRAKTNLAVFWVYQSKEFLAEQLSLKSKVGRIAEELCKNNPESFTNANFITNPYIHSENKESLEFPPILKNYFDINNHFLELKQTEKELESVNLKNLFLNKKNKLYGSAVHFYLSFIKYNQSDEHEIAKLQTIRLYGNILKKQEIETIIIKAKNFIQHNPDYFHQTWDKVFNEFTILDKNKKLFRIDRIMINTQDKKIMIIDYKTGQITDENQILHYTKLIKDIPAYKNENYAISAKFVSVE